MLKNASLDSRKAATGGNSRQAQASQVPKVSPPVPMMGNQATLRLQRKCDCGGSPECDCDSVDHKKKEKESPRTGLHRKADNAFAPSAVPAIVDDTLRSAGQTLDPETRAFFEARFGQDFSGVRIHADSRAAQSARAVDALAYTVGHQIAFAPGRYAPGTSEGRRLIAHELAHVVQQPAATQRPESVSKPSDPLERNADQIAEQVVGSAADTFQPVPAVSSGPAGQTAVARQAANTVPSPNVPGQGQSGVAPAPTPEAVILQWLNRHQFAPPANQPDDAVAPSKPAETTAAPPNQQTASAAQAATAQAKPELHVLLNGEDMTVSDAVKLAAADLKDQPPELIKSVIVAQVVKPFAKTAAGLPFIGPGNEIPGIYLSSPKDAFGVNPAITRTVEFSTIDNFLSAHGFDVPAVRDPTGNMAILDGENKPVDEIANLAYAILGQYPSLKKSDVVTYIRQKYVEKRGGPGNQIVFGYMLVPKAAQFVGGPADPRNPLRTQHQFSFTITRQHHANDSPGFETSFQGTVTLTDQGILNVQAGGQEAIVLPLLNGWIQVSGLIQVMASENWSKSASGTTVITPALQVAGGGQVLLTPQIRSGAFKFLTGHVQLGVQVLGGSQTTSSGTVGVANAGLVLNIPLPF